MKTMMKNAAILVVAASALAGCINPQSYETTPVEVKTPKGVVVCQLYTQEQVIWDRAISIPQGMTIEQGDQYCKQEGYRRLKR